MTSNNVAPLDICNDALVMVLSTPINDVTNPSTPKEVICASMYALTIADLFARHDWSFANQQRQLQVDADETPTAGYTYAYRLPSDLLAGPFAVYADGRLDSPRHDYIVQDDYVHANYTRVDVLYRAGADPSIWPGYFRMLVTVALAARLARPVASNTDLQTELRIEAFGDAEGNASGGKFADAKRLDTMTKPTKSIFQNGDPLTRARLGGLSGFDMSRFRIS